MIDINIAGKVVVSGAIGKSGIFATNRSKYLNGVFEMTAEECNGMPVYRKVGDSDIWLEMIKTDTNGWRWCIKPTKRKGPNSSDCYGYGTSDNIVFPQDCDPEGWCCHDGKTFLNEKNIKCELFRPEVPLPEKMRALLQNSKESFQKHLEFLEQERVREPKEGSVVLQGATVERSKYFVNGIFEPTEEMCNDMAVYQKKGDPDTCMEVVKTNPGEWSWCIKPTKGRGPDASSVCFGYGRLNEKGSPQQCRASKWCCYDGWNFVTESTITCTLYETEEMKRAEEEAKLKLAAEEKKVTSTIFSMLTNNLRLLTALAFSVIF